MKIAIVGTPGCGKTTLALELAARLGVQATSLDNLYWKPDWTAAEATEFQADVERRCAEPNWVIDGNYELVREQIWLRAETLLWLDYSIFTVLWRLLRRSVGRVLKREKLPHGNRETLRLHFSKESIWLWVFKTHWKRRREYAELLRDPRYKHLKVHRFRKPAELKNWLASF